MAQVSDLSIANATFPTVRADINSTLAALFSDNSGDNQPTVTVAYQDWIDTSGANPLWKKRNAANNAWITLGTISGNTIAFEGTLPSQSGNADKYLSTDGTAATWEPITANGQLLRAPQVLTSGVSYTTPANCTAIYVEAVGGGGGGRANASGDDYGGGGGSGAYCAKYFAVTGSVTYTYAIGAGGAGGTAGGSTTFTVGGTTITAGGGGSGSASRLGGAGGSATNGDINVAGNIGGGVGSDTAAITSVGGSSFFGGAGRAPTAGTTGGGGGGDRPGFVRSAGGAGLIRIWEFS